MSVSVILGGVPIGDTGSPRVVASSVQTTWDDQGGIIGPGPASFQITADPRDPLPTLAPYTPVLIDIDGERNWSGLVQNSNRAGRMIGVTCQGQKTHLDGDLVEILGLDTDPASWTGVFTLIGETLYDARPNSWQAPANGAELVSVASQGITLSWPTTQAGYSNGANMAICAACVKWPFQATAVSIAVSFTASIAGRFRVWATNQLTPVGARSDLIDVPDTTSLGIFRVNAAIPAPTRYIKFGWGWSPSASFAAPAVATVSLIWLSGVAAAAVFPTATDLARRVSVLIPELSADLSQTVQTPTLIGQSAWPAPGASGAAILSEIAAYDDPLLGVDGYNRLVFQPRTPAPVLELGNDTPATSEVPSDPSVLVSQVIVSGTDLSQQPFTARYTPLDLPETLLVPSPSVSVPAFTSGAWAASPASALVAAGAALQWRFNNGPTYSAIAANEYMYTSLTGTFQAGKTYMLLLTIEDPTLYAAGKEALSAHTVDVWVGDTGDLAGMAERQVRVYPTPYPYTITWTPRKTTSTAFLLLYNLQARAQTYSDGRYAYYSLKPNLTVLPSLYEAAVPTLLARQNNTRTGLVSVPLVANDELGKELAYAYLRGTTRQGYTATRTAADGAAKDAASHAPLSASAVQRSVGKLARLADRHDPTTGAVGPSAYVSAVTYNHSTRVCTITLGQRYGDFASLLARAGNPGHYGPARWR